MRLGEAQPFASPEEALEHFGIKGMKWGVRNDKSPLVGLTGGKVITRTTANGDTFTVSQRPPNKLIKSLAAISDNYRNSYNQSASLVIKGEDGKKIGEAGLWIKNKDDLYLNWVHIEKSARGRGYASEVLKAAGEHAKTKGMKRMVLEVPGNAPDARHIYEKMGFNPTGKTMGAKNDTWGGLTEMEYKFDD